MSYSEIIYFRDALYIVLYRVFYRILFLPTRSSLGQSYVIGINAHPRLDRADNLIGSHGRGYTIVRRSELNVGIRNTNISFSVLAAILQNERRRGARKGDREKEREREQDTTSAGEFEGRQSVAGGTSGTT